MNNKKIKKLYRINENIISRHVRLVGDNIESGVYSLVKALDIAKNKNLDLVEINPTIDPPICKILEYKKFLYDQKRKRKQIKFKQEKVVTKEIRLGPQTGDHDVYFKIKNAKKFLKSREKVKFSIFFKGRAIIYKEQGELLLLKCAESLKNFGSVEQMPILDGKKMFIIIIPKKIKKK